MAKVQVVMPPPTEAELHGEAPAAPLSEASVQQLVDEHAIDLDVTLIDKAGLLEPPLAEAVEQEIQDFQQQQPAATFGKWTPERAPSSERGGEHPTREGWMPGPPPPQHGISVEEFSSLRNDMDRIQSMLAGLLMQQSAPPTPAPVIQQDRERIEYGRQQLRDDFHVTVPPPDLPPRPPLNVSTETKAAAACLIGLLEADDGRMFKTFCTEENVSEAEAIRATLCCAIQQHILQDKVRSFIRFSTQAAVHREGCPVCQLPFHPSRAGQVYCCGACGAKAIGKRPVVEHAPDCPTGRGQAIPTIWGDNAMSGAEPVVHDHQPASPFYRQR